MKPRIHRPVTVLLKLKITKNFFILFSLLFFHKEKRHFTFLIFFSCKIQSLKVLFKIFPYSNCYERSRKMDISLFATSIESISSIKTINIYLKI